MEITLVSYGGSGQREMDDDNWAECQNYLNHTATKHGGITRTISWNRAKLEQTDFYQQNKGILDQPRGSGYWLWKPYVILQALQQSNDGDIVVYHDTGRPQTDPEMRYRFTRSIKPLINFCQQNGGFLPGVYVPHYGPNGQWTKRDCFVLMDCDEARYQQHCQIQATYSVWQKNPQVIAFVEEWLAWCTDSRVLTDDDNVMGQDNYAEFTEHRHDQSVLTNLVIKHKIPCYGSPHRSIYRYRNINFLAKRIYADMANQQRKPNLADICRRYGSDKQKHGFLRTYQYWMEDQRDADINLLEVGVFYGASLKMWRDYFPNGQIHGLDWFKGLNGNGRWFPDGEKFLKEQAISPERLSLYQVDQGNRARMEEFAEQMLASDIRFDFIIDDGSHLMRDQQMAMGILFPLLKTGGIFIMEDIHSSKHPEHYADIRPEGDNTTLAVFRKFTNEGKFQSLYLTRAEQDYLTARIGTIQTMWFREGRSGTSVVTKKPAG